MTERRDIALAIVFTVLTCGIYSIFWFIKLTDEINSVAGDTDATSGGLAFVFSLITCGLYTYYWMYKMGEKLDNIAVIQGRASQSRGLIYLVLSLLGFSIISYALMQDSLNKSI